MVFEYTTTPLLTTDRRDHNRGARWHNNRLKAVASCKNGRNQTLMRNDILWELGSGTDHLGIALEHNHTNTTSTRTDTDITNYYHSSIEVCCVNPILGRNVDMVKSVIARE